MAQDFTIAEGNTSFDGLGVLVYGASVTVAGTHRFGQVGLYGGAEVTHAGSSLQVASALVEGGSTFHAAGGSTVTVDGLLAPLGEGLYQLTARSGESTGLRDLAGQALDQNRDGFGDDLVMTIDVDFTAPAVTAVGPGTALELDGANDTVRVPLAAAPAYGQEATVELWFAYTGTARDQLVLQNVGNTGASFYLNRFRTGGALFLFDGDSGNEGIDFGGSLNDGRWHHAAGVFDHGTVRVYVDGKLAGTKSKTLLVGQPVASFGSAGGASSFFGGQMRDVRLWNVARSEAEVRGSMSAALAGTEPGLVGLWPMDEGIGTVVGDRGPLGNHGTLGAGVAAKRPARVACAAPVQRSTIRVTFADVGGLDPATVEAPASYRVLASGGDGTFGDGDEIDLTAGIVFARFDPLTSSVMLQLGAPLADDYYQLTILGSQVVDLAGNPLLGGGDYVSAPLAVVDRAAHVGVDLRAESDSGFSDSDNLTNDNTPAVDVTVDKRGLVEVDFDGDSAFDASLAVASAGTCQFVSPMALADGAGTIRARFTPWVGDAVDATLVVTVDTQGPKGVPVAQAAVAPCFQRQVSFSEALAPGSFAPEDTTLIGPGNQVLGSAIACDAGPLQTTYTLSFDPLSQPGDYRLLVGPEVRDLAGNLMDQDGDRTGGESGHDVLEDRFTIAGGLAAGLYVARLVPAGAEGRPFDKLQVVFSQPLDETTFEPADVELTSPTGQPIALGGITRLGSQWYELDFSGRVGTVYIHQTDSDLISPIVVSHQPSGTVNHDVSSLILQFSEPILAESFTREDVTVLNPSGGTVEGALVSVVEIGSGIGKFEIQFPAQTANGRYRVLIGPQVTDLAGNPMVAPYEATFKIDKTGPRVTSTTPAGVVHARLESIDLAFDLAIDAASFRPEDVVLKAPDGSVVPVTTVTALGPSSFRLGFARQTAAGLYSLAVGPNVTNTIGTPMDQDRDGTPGEAEEDVFRTTILLKQPNLAFASAGAPTTVYNGQTLPIHWTATNTGDGTAPASWIDRVVLSKDAFYGSFDDVLLGTFAHSGSVESDATYTQVESVRVPENLAAGVYTIFVKTDALGQVNEPTGEENNVGRLDPPIQVMLAPVADLRVAAVAGPDTGVIGQPAVVTWTVRNAGGAAAAGPWTNRVYLSRDGSLQGAALLGSFVHEGQLGQLEPGADAQGSGQVVLPAWADGDYWLVAVADAANQVFERDGENNNAGVSATTIHLSHPDLAVSEIQPIGQQQSGGTFTARWRVRNAGTGTTPGGWSDKVYLSTDDQLSAGDTLLGSLAHSGALAAGGQYADLAALAVTLPDGIAGTFYVLVKADAADVVQEGVGEGNNAAASGAFAVTVAPYADLVVDEVVADAVGQNGQTIHVTWTVSNLGIGPTNDDTWSDRVWLATDAQGSGRVDLAAVSHAGALEVNGSYVRSVEVTLPIDATGTRYVFVTTGGPFEFIYTDNNTSHSGPVQVNYVPPPTFDLEVTGVTGPAAAEDAQDVDVTWTVRNNGPDRLDAPWYDTVYAAPNGNMGQAVELGRFSYAQGLAAGRQYTRTERLRLPSRIQGIYQFFVKSDSAGEIVESREDNNLRGADDPTTVSLRPRPDLQVTSILAPDRVTAGGVIDVEFTVKNLGIVATPTGGSRWTDGVYAFDGDTILVHYKVTNQGAGITFPASWADSIWLTVAKDRPDSRRGDVLLGSFGHSGALEVGQSYERTVQVKVPEHQHLRGQYYVTAWTDPSDAVYEQTFDVNLNPDAPNDIDGNNFKAGTPLNVFYRPPADLEVTRVTAPAAALAGQPVTVSWTVANNGAAPTDLDTWADAIYVSTDAVLHDGKGQEWLVFGVPHSGALASGESYAQSASFTLPICVKGSYLIVETNVDPALVRTTEPDSLAELAQQIEGITSRAQEILGKPLEQATAADLNRLSRQDINYILFGGEQGSEPRQVWEGPFTENNSHSAACEVTNLHADLTVTEVLVPAAAFSGEAVEVSWTVTNLSEVPVWAGTQRWVDYVILSPDPQMDATDPASYFPYLGRATVVGSVVHVADHPLAQGETYTARATIQLPAGIEGRRYVQVLTDRNPGVEMRYGALDDAGPQGYPGWLQAFRQRVWEDGAKWNNTRGSGPIEVTYREPDLRITALDVPAGAGSGGMIALEWTVANEGSRATRVGTWLDRVYISQDPSLDFYDKILGSVRHDGVLGAGQTYTATATVRLPNNIEGDFYILVYTDSPVGRPAWGGTPLPYPIARGP